jgi:hypothetical protein
MVSQTKKRLKKLTDVAKKTVAVAKKIEKASVKVGKIGAASARVLADPSPSSIYGLGKSIFGNGDYTVRSNSILSGSLVGEMAMQVPSFAGNRRKLVVRHREYIGDVISSSTSNAFSLTSYTINPGSVQTFPWLSKISL